MIALKNSLIFVVHVLLAATRPLGSVVAQRCDKDGRPSLRMVLEAQFATLFPFGGEEDGRFEVSDVIVEAGGIAHAVCDSSWSLYRFSADRLGQDIVRIGDPSDDHGAKKGDGSDFEALLHDPRDGAFYVFRESVPIKRRIDDGSSGSGDDEENEYHAIIEELVVLSDDDDYTLRDQCPCEFVFEGDSKGFEGAVSIRDSNDELIVLGLCEGNHCSEERKGDRGNGRLVALRKVENDGEMFEDFTCHWETVRMIELPPSADFGDYASIALDERSGRVAVVSQHDGRVWVGQLDGRDEVTGLWDVDAMEFRGHSDDDDVVYDLPKDDSCETVYCNVEGIHWMNNRMLMAVSDKAKKDQDERCKQKEQSVHVFVLPLQLSVPPPLLSLFPPPPPSPSPTIRPKRPPPSISQQPSRWCLLGFC